jgi:hypothetical protein
MAFIGTPLDTRNTFQSLAGKRFDGDGSTTAFTLDVAPSSTLDIEVFVGNVRQDPNSAYTLSGTTLTFTGAPPSGTNNIYVVHQAKSVGTINAPDNSVNSAQLNTALLTGATDIGANIADADLFLIDDGAGGTLRKTAASRIKTYVGGASTLNELTDVSMDITNFQNGILIQSGSDGSAPTTGTLSTATGNVGIGHNVMKTITSGDYNVAVGHGALDALTTGQYNVAIGGDSPLGANNTGTRNIAIGNGALLQPDGENDNIAIGSDTLTGAVSGGEYNVAIGTGAGTALTSGDSNVMMGYQAGEDNTSGYDNVFVGYQAGKSMTTGYKNVCIGDTVDVTSDNQTSIAIGSDLSSSDNNLSNNFIFGKSGNIVRNQFSSNANWARNSDERIKRNIKNQKLGLDFINDLRTVTFQWKPSYEIPKNLPNYNEENKMDLDVVMHGFIAQEVEQVMIKHGDMDFAGWTKDEAKSGNEGQLQHISREMFVIPLVKAVQELSAEVKELKEKLENK